MTHTAIVAAAARADGDLEPSFGDEGLVTRNLEDLQPDVAMAVLPDGRIVLAGATTGATVGIALARFTAAGLPDPNFGTGGAVVVADERVVGIAGVAVQPGGQLVVVGTRRAAAAGSEGNVLVARFDDAGNPDTSFSDDGFATVDLGDDDQGRALVVQPDGKIVVAGARIASGTSRVGVARLTVAGALDPTFSGDGKLSFDFGGSDAPTGMALQGDGRIVVAATRDTATASDVAVARIKPDGTLDPSFSENGKANIDFGGDETGGGVVVQGDGKLVVVGTRAGATGSDVAVARLRSDGTLDRSFGGNGKRVVDFGGNESGRGIALQTDGRVVVVGTRVTTNATDFAVARFDGDGALDLRFSGNGKLTQDFAAGTDLGLAVGVQPSGRLIAAGHRTRVGATGFALAGFQATPRPPVGNLEIPGPGAPLSGIGLASGWACEAGSVSLEIDGEFLVETAYRTARADTKPICNDEDNGFGLLFNWNLLGGGPHEARALADGVEFARASFTVTTLGEAFVSGLAASFDLPGFPHAGQTARVVWQEGKQNFVVTGILDGVTTIGAAEGAASLAARTSQAPAAAAAGPRGALEIPAPGSTQSGIGLASGWACDASEIVLEIDGALRLTAGYGTSRGDTAAICGTADTGFGLLFNWALLGAGSHHLRALDGTTVIGEATFQVATLGDTFLRGISYSRRLEGFPAPGEAVTIEWVEAQQAFVIVDHEG